MKFSPILCFHLFIVITRCSPIENAASKPVFTAQYQACLQPLLGLGINNSGKILEPVVGVGFDNLQDVPTSLIFERSFSECKISSNQAFLYPDNVLLISVNKIDLDYMARSFTRFDDYFRSTANSINIGFSASKKFSISGSFGVKWQDAKRLIELEKNAVFRTTLKYHEYTVTLQTGSPLHASFKQALLTVAHAETDSYARYLAEMIVRNFGTHVIVKADTGAIIEQEDFIELSLNHNTSLSEFNLAVSVDFAVNIFGKGVGSGLSPAYKYTSVEQALKKLEASKRHSKMKATGGLVLIKKLTEGMASATQLDNGKKISAQTIPNHSEESATLNRYGEPLYAMIAPHHLPELNSSTFEKLRSYLEDAIVNYYEQNKIEGCTDPRGANYDATANFDNGKCAAPFHSYSFGGVFQTIEIFNDKTMEWQTSDKKWTSFSNEGHYYFPGFPNKATGKYSCRDDFEQIKLYTYDHTVNVPGFFSDTKYECRRTTFWCRRKEKDNKAIPSNSGFMFGGVFTKTVKNPYTQTFKCPGNFQQLKLNLSTYIDDWLAVCVSQDYQHDNQYQVPFSGFFSCQTSNEFAKCPDGYTQRPLIETYHSNCDIFYCVHPNSTRNTRLPEIRLPPFSKPNFEKNSTILEVIAQPYNKEENTTVISDEVKEKISDKNGSTSWQIPIIISVIILALIVLIFLIIKYKNTTIRTREDRAGRYESVNKDTPAVQLNVF